mmetsp:Transcript_12828/g.38519  ORF Transcript_12828/g.38519 Transcript_12828/m.38519 type:complete len:206 (-) Transcript_12828:164-781(-)
MHAVRLARIAARTAAIHGPRAIMARRPVGPAQAHRAMAIMPSRSLFPSFDRFDSMMMSRFGATDVVTHDDHIEFQIDAPGLKKEDLNINISIDNVLTITGKRSAHNSSGDSALAGDDGAPSDDDGTAESPTDPSGDSTPTKKEAAEVAGRGTTRWSERSFSSFTRSFQLPSTASVDQIEATLADGVLTLNVPTEAPRTVEIKTNE